MVSISNDDIEYLLNLWFSLCSLWRLFNIYNNFMLFQTTSVLCYGMENEKWKDFHFPFPNKCWDCLEKPFLLSRYSMRCDQDTIFDSLFFTLNFYDLIRYCFWRGFTWWDLWIIWNMKTALWLWNHTIKRDQRKELSELNSHTNTYFIEER